MTWRRLSSTDTSRAEFWSRWPTGPSPSSTGPSVTANAELVPGFSPSAELQLVLIRNICCVSSSRQPVGLNQLPPAGSGPTPSLHPLHDGGARQGVVRLQEQDLRHPAQGHEDRGTAETGGLCAFRAKPCSSSLCRSRSPSTLTPARRARCGSWPGWATASGCPSAWTPPSACSTLTPTSTCRTWTLSPTLARC